MQKYTPKYASMAITRFLGGILGVAFVVASFAFSINCYFNVLAIWVSISFTVGLFLAAAARMYMRGIFAQTITRGSPAAQLISVYILTAASGAIVLIAALSLAVLGTSRRAVSEQVQLGESNSGRGCKPSYYFHDNEAGRTISVCRNIVHFSPKPNNLATVQEKVGPFGIKVLSVEFPR
jgi:hypothetical protein